MAAKDKYQSLIDMAGAVGIINLNVLEDGEVLRVTGAATSEGAKQKLWDEYNRLDPDMRSGDLVLDIDVIPGGAGDEYTIAAGDTLSAIGKKHGVSWQEIHEANRDTIKDPDKIFPGQKIRIPRK